MEQALYGAGFEQRIPAQSGAFAGGDGSAIEEAPIGYYQFHFWKNDSQPKSKSINPFVELTI